MPDRLDENDAPGRLIGAWAFLATLVCFFLAEMGDKTQVATVLLAARLDGLVAVVLCGHALASRVPAKTMRTAAALLFAGLGAAVLAGWIG